MLISIIIPLCGDQKNSAEALGKLAGQGGDYEIILVDGDRIDRPETLVGKPTQVVSSPSEMEGAQLDAGAAAARGDVLLFLDPASQLPPDALLAIQRNLKLLTETIGGNFHLKFKRDTLFARLLICLLKWWRYRGNYCGNSGIFIRTEVYQAIGGFRPNASLTDYDIARRMERYGPTLYLPETIIAPLPGYWEGLKWVIAPISLRLKRMWRSRD